MKYHEQMLQKPMRKLTIEDKVPFGALIGFKASYNDEITAAYPLWSKNGRNIQFVLFGEDKHPTIDGDAISEHGTQIYINNEPIIIQINCTNEPKTFADRLISFFP